jgi:hypothetical protein
MADLEEHTGGMVALLPTPEHAEAMALPGGEPEDILHVTAVYLGDDVTGWSLEQQRQVIDAVMTATSGVGPVEGRAFGHATFNADGGPDGDRDPCAVYLIGDSDALVPLREAIVSALGGADLPDQHSPYVPHVTAGYGKNAGDLSYTGPVTLDRVLIAFGGEHTVIPLAGAPEPVAAGGNMPRFARFRVRDGVDQFRALTASGGPADVISAADAEVGIVCAGCEHVFEEGERYGGRAAGKLGDIEVVDIVCETCADQPEPVAVPINYGQDRDLPDPEGWVRGSIPVVVVEGFATGDGRIIPPGSLSGHRALPIALMSLSKTSEGGHLDATLMGRIDHLERVPGPDVINVDTGEPFPEGTFVWRSGEVWVNPEHQDYSWVRNGALTGISVDLAETLADLEFNEDDPDDEGMLVLRAGRIAASTLCTIPAFPGAHFVFDADPAEVEAPIAASGESHDVLVWANAPGGRTSMGKELPAGWVWVCSCGASGNGLDSEEAADAAALAHEGRVAPIRASAGLAFRLENEALCASCQAPPAEWFEDPGLDAPSGITVTPEGRVYGHIAAWSTCHIGLPGCVTPPRSGSSYEYFLTGAVMLADGSTVPAGRLTVATGHPDLSMSASDTAAHYDHTGTAVADVTAGEDAHGIWVAGAIRPGATEDQIRVLRASPPSGDWRDIGGSLELVGVLCVNVPGFPIPRARARVAAGIPRALVAAGAITKEAPVAPDQAPPSTDDTAGLQPGDMVTIGDTDLQGVVTGDSGDGMTTVELVVDSSMLNPVDSPAPADDPVLASAALLRLVRAEQVLGHIG